MVFITVRNVFSSHRNKVIKFLCRHLNFITLLRWLLKTFRTVINTIRHCGVSEILVPSTNVTSTRVAKYSVCPALLSLSAQPSGCVCFGPCVTWTRVVITNKTARRCLPASMRHENWWMIARRCDRRSFHDNKFDSPCESLRVWSYRQRQAGDYSPHYITLV